MGKNARQGNMEGNTDRTPSLDRSDSMPIATSSSVIESQSPPVASLAIAVGHQCTPQIVESSRRQPMQEVMAWSASSSGENSAFNLSSMSAALGDHPNPSSYASQQQQQQQNLHRQQQQQQQLLLQQQQQLSVTASAGSQRFAYHPQHHTQAFDSRFLGNQPGSPGWIASYGQQYPLPYRQRPHPTTGSSSGMREFALNHPQMSPGQLNIGHNVMDYRDHSPWVAQPQHQAQHLGPYLYSTAPYLPSAERFPGGPVAGYPTSFSARENISPGAGQYSQPDYLAAGSERSRQAATAAGYRLPDYSPGPGLHTSSPSGIAVDSRHGSGEPSTSPFPLMPRGPPRKPRQSGHALWVGNLPPGTHITDLKDHFSREAMKDIESVFLISKSNCAFVNYKTEATCASAMTRFHDSRFQGIRLVCRLRRNSASPPPGVPRGPAADSKRGSALMTAARRKVTSEALPDEDDAAASAKPLDRGGLPETRGNKDQYFVVKSLTLEDLEMSVKNGIWATQAHNEAGLNKAYDSADVVYLIFSANKSGEYFGYARMASRIEDDSVSNIEWAPKSVEAEASDLPKATLTPATATAPRGKIIDDSARGTIFWEAEAVVDPDAASKAGQDASSGEEEEREGSSPDTAWGRPFKIEWISTTRLPFYRTRGLRNPWNANREVKIARDGTELETSVGRRLLTMFNRPGLASSTGSYVQSSSASQPSQDGSQQMPNMRPY